MKPKNKDIDAQISVVECRSAITKLVNKHPKNKSLFKLCVLWGRMDACYLLKCFDECIAIGNYVRVLMERYERFWYQGERYGLYSKKIRRGNR
jgi:hypothetical protein